MVGELLSSGGSHGTSEDILVLLLWEIDIIVSVGMGEFSSVVSVILPGRVGSQVGMGSVAPVFNFQVRHGLALIVVGHLHGSLVGLVIDSFGSKVPLLLLSKALEHVVGAHLHNRYFLIVAGIIATRGSAVLELPDFSIATSGDVRWLQSHELGLLHVGVAHGTVLVTQSLTLSVGVPVIVGLVVPVVLLERVIQVTIHPGRLGDVPEVKWHLSVLSRLVVVQLTKRVDLLVETGVDHLVSEIVVGSALVPEVLWGTGRVEIVGCHI